MIVKELIEKLENVPQDKEVRFINIYEGKWSHVVNAEYDELYNVVWLYSYSRAKVKGFLRKMLLFVKIFYFWNRK